MLGPTAVMASSLASSPAPSSVNVAVLKIWDGAGVLTVTWKVNGGLVSSPSETAELKVTPLVEVGLPSNLTGEGEPPGVTLHTYLNVTGTSAARSTGPAGLALPQLTVAAPGSTIRLPGLTPVTAALAETTMDTSTSAAVVPECRRSLMCSSVRVSMDGTGVKVQLTISLGRLAAVVDSRDE